MDNLPSLSTELASLLLPGSQAQSASGVTTDAAGGDFSTLFAGFVLTPVDQAPVAAGFLAGTTPIPLSVADANTVANDALQPLPTVTSQPILPLTGEHLPLMGSSTEPGAKTLTALPAVTLPTQQQPKHLSQPVTTASLLAAMSLDTPVPANSVGMAQPDLLTIEEGIDQIELAQTLGEQTEETAPLAVSKIASKSSLGLDTAITSAGTTEATLENIFSNPANLSNPAPRLNPTNEMAINLTGFNVAPTPETANAPAGGKALENPLAMGSGSINLLEAGFEYPMSQTVQFMAKQGLHNARLTVNPPELGAINIQLEIQNNNDVKIHLMTHTIAARELLEGAAPILKELLVDGGMSLTQLDVSQRDQQQAAMQQHTYAEQHNDHEQSAQPSLSTPDDQQAAEPASLVISEQLLDIYA